MLHLRSLPGPRQPAGRVLLQDDKLQIFRNIPGTLAVLLVITLVPYGGSIGSDEWNLTSPSSSS